MDLKIELTNLYALDKAAIDLDHGIKRKKTSSGWITYSPSIFIHAYFAFNGIYSYNWEDSFLKNQPVRWQPDKNGNIPHEKEQFKSYINFVHTKLRNDALDYFSQCLRSTLLLFNPDWGLENILIELEVIKLLNPDNRLKELKKQFPKKFKLLYEKKMEPANFSSEVLNLLQFIYDVRCNLFHGSKTNIELFDLSQQRRFLIYSSVLAAANSLLFWVAERADIGWMRVKVDF